YTAANVTQVAISPEKYSFRFQFPVGETHHFLLRGIKQYTEIQIWKIPWRIDARFEYYNVGAYYIPEEKLLMVKYNHKIREEEFLITFSAEGSGVSPAEEGSAPPRETE
ncbi:MAG: hypothetical protein FWG35_08015, partial [Spirochaetaceae bacterium]|nr:hypothetical protein [Spirochaetaceae bacterium]